MAASCFFIMISLWRVIWTTFSVADEEATQPQGFLFICSKVGLAVLSSFSLVYHIHFECLFSGLPDLNISFIVGCFNAVVTPAWDMNINS